jgi:F420H(2)-dependent biliverdin reductase
VGAVTRIERLNSDQNVWLAAVRPDGRPHLTPIWFVWVDDRMWVCTQANAVKAKLIAANPKVSVALEDGNAPVCGEGTATVHPVADTPASVRAAFKAKFQWDLAGDNDYGVIIEIAIDKWLFPSTTVVT